MPLVTAKCSIVSNTMGGGGGDYWITAIGSSDARFDCGNTATGLLSDNSVVFSTLCGTAVNTYNYSFGKLTPSGELDWARQYDNQYDKVFSRNINAQLYVDEDDNFYSTHYFDNTASTAVNRAGITGFSSTGTKLTNDYHYGITSSDCRPGNVIPGRGGSAIIFSMGDSALDDVHVITHIPATGFVGAYKIFQTPIFNLASTFVVPAWQAGSRTELIIAEEGTNDYIYIAKINAFGGGIQYEKKLSGDGATTTSVNVGSCVVDANEKYYLGYSDGTNGNTFMSKFTDTGTTISVDWTAKINTGTAGSRATPAVDSNGNVYFLAYLSLGALLCKFDSSGTLQWQRRLSLTYNGALATSFVASSLSIDSNDNPVLSGYAINPHLSSGPTPTQTGLWAAKLPSDGSGTGTYNFSGGVVADYSTSSDTITSSTAVVSAPVQSSNYTTLSLNNTVHSSTDSAISLLDEKVAVS